MVEWYEAYADYEDATDRLEAVVRAAASTVAEPAIDFGVPWLFVTLTAPTFILDWLAWAELVDELLSTSVEPTLADAVLERTGIDVRSGSGASRSPPTVSRRAFAVREAAPQAAGPHGALGGLRRRIELANAFTKLNDPDDQRARLEDLRAHAPVGEEPQPVDEAFLAALE